METIDSIEHLEALYDDAVPGSLTKVRTFITPAYRKWIDSSRFVVLSSVGPAGTDASPRGDTESVAKVRDQNTLWIPDWRGNNRLDSLRNIVQDGRVSLMFMIPGNNNVVRVNGLAALTADPEVTTQFERKNVHPKTVIMINVVEVYFQCAKSLMRSQLWQSTDSNREAPTAGAFIKEVRAEFDAEQYDAGYAEYSKDRMW
ncbi:pyridoxamine 5'-phosphate oxidase family protein [Congregibacter variabilis]|uniref:Pyridoxamine 5'-phosphate oxidase family protein n=1 Tax=Congregibacter variabilis TaxID=3081200 RepID=A0ABZ0I8S9_9GAMM|nr:pyridoxamine 5'-phosphate oxidase family protein [Congregibacter sp. IMCC43200]